MLLRFLSLFLAVSFSTLALAKERVLVDLSLIEQLSDAGCSLQKAVFNCGGQDLVLKGSTRHDYLKVKAAHIEVQGKVEGERLDLEATEDIVVAEGASLFLRKSSSMSSQGEFRVHGGLFALKVDVLSSSVLFVEGADVQVQNLNIQTAYFRMKNHLVAQLLRISLAEMANVRKAKLSIPYAEFNGYLQAQLLTVKGPGSGSQFVVTKQGFLDVEQILVITKSYLNLGKMRFSTMKINGQEHSSYGRTEGLKYAAAAEQVNSHQNALYRVHSAQTWGYDCKDEGRWDVKNRLGFYCQTMTAGQHSVWHADSIRLAGGSYFLDNSIETNELHAQVQTFYSTKTSTQKIARAIVLAKYLLLDGTWQGQEGNFFANAIFFGPNANVNIKHLEIIIRNKESKLVRELLNSKEKSHLDQIEKIFEQLLAQEDQFSRAFTASLFKGQFALERRWQLHQFRNKIYDSFKEKNATWVANRLALLRNEFGLSGTTGVENFATLRQAAFISDEQSPTFPMIIFGAINSHNLKITSDGKLYFDTSSKVDVSKLLQVHTRSYLFVDGKIRSKIINLLARSFVLSESELIGTTDRARIQLRQQLILRGLLSSSHENSISAQGGEIYIGKSALMKSSECTSIDTDHFYLAGEIEGACLHLSGDRVFLGVESQIDIATKASLKSSGEMDLRGKVRAKVIDIFADQFRLSPTAKVTAQQLLKVYTRLNNTVEGLLQSDGSIVISSDGELKFTETSNVHAVSTLSIKAEKFANHGKVSAAQIDIDVKELRTFASSRLDARDINIRTISGQLAGLLSSDRLFINASGKLEILAGADLQAKAQAHIKVDKDLEVKGSIKSKVIELFAANIDLLEEGKLSAEESMLVKADLQLKIKGLLNSDGTLQVEGERVFFSDSSIVHAASIAHIRAKHLEARGALDASDLSIVSDSLKSSSASLIRGQSVQLDLVEADLYGIINSKNLVINAEKRIVLRDAAKILAEDSATLKEGAYVELAGEIRAKVISLFARDLVLLKSAKLTAEQSSEIRASFKAKLDGLLESSGSLVVIAGELEIAQTGKITAKETQIKSDSFLSSGTVSGKDVLILDIDKSFSNAGTLQGGKVQIHTNKNYANTGAISAVEDLYVKVSAAVTAKELGKTSSGSWMTLQGEFLSDDVLDLLEGNSGRIQTPKLRVITTKPVVINRHVSSSFANDVYASSLTLEEDKIYSAQGDISLNVGTVYAKAGSRLHSEGSLQINADGDVIQVSERNSDNGNIKTSEMSADGSLRIMTKGRYANIGSRLQAKETLLIKAEGGVVIVPLLWVETSEDVEEGWFTKKTTIRNEEKEHRASLGGKNIEIETDLDSTLENVNWIGEKKFSPKLSEVHRELKIDETSYKSYTGLGKVVMTAVRTASILASNLVPGGNFVAGIALSYLESQILNQKFELKAALKQAVIGAIAGEIANSAVGAMGALGGSVAGAVTRGAVRGSAVHLAQSCLNDGCKKIDLNQLGSAAFVGAVHGGITAGKEGGFLEHTAKEAGAGFVGDIGVQAMQGGDIKWEQAGESGVLSAVAYTSAQATSELLKPNSIEPPVIAKDENKELKGQRGLESTQQEKVEEPKRVEPTSSVADADQKPNIAKETKATVVKLAPSQRPTGAKKISPKRKVSPDPVSAPRSEPTLETVQESQSISPSSRSEENKAEDLVDSVCFAAGTRVRTGTGWESIEALREGDTVISCDFQGEQCVSKTITKTMVSDTLSIVHLKVNGELIEITPNHPVYVVDDGQEEFVAIGTLKVGDTILALNGERLAIEELEIEKLAEPMKVYNLEVDYTHNYYVSSPDGEPQDLLVHNCDVAQKLGKHTKDFGAGLVAGAAESIAGEQVKTRGNKAFEDGRFAGKLSGAVAQVATGLSGVVAAGGAALAACATGVGCPMASGAVAAAGVSAAVAVHGSHLMMESLAKAPELVKQEGGLSKGSDHSVMMNEKLGEGSAGVKQRNKPPEPDLNAEGPHTIIERPGKDGQYTTHNGDGTYKQYRGSGKAHGPIPRPNVKENQLNTNRQTGKTYPSDGEVRPANPEEIPGG